MAEDPIASQANRRWAKIRGQFARIVCPDSARLQPLKVSGLPTHAGVVIFEDLGLSGLGDEAFILHPFFKYLRTLRSDFGYCRDAGDQRRPGRL